MENSLTLCSWIPRNKAFKLTLSKWKSEIPYSLRFENLPSLYSNPKTCNSSIKFFSSIDEVRQYCLSAGLL